MSWVDREPLLPRQLIKFPKSQPVCASFLPCINVYFPDQEKLLSRQGQQGWNRLFDLLQAELAMRPADVHVNMKLVELYSKDGRLDEAVKHCLSTEKKVQLRKSLEWYSVVVHMLQVSHYVFWVCVIKLVSSGCQFVAQPAYFMLSDRLSHVK